MSLNDRLFHGENQGLYTSGSAAICSDLILRADQRVYQNSIHSYASILRSKPEEISLEDEDISGWESLLSSKEADKEVRFRFIQKQNTRATRKNRCTARNPCVCRKLKAQQSVRKRWLP
jgi:hypothetical protein